MRRSALAALTCLLLAPSLIAARDRADVSSDPSVRNVHKVSPGQLLEIDLDTGGELNIVAWDRDEVSVVTSDAGADCPDGVISLEGEPRGARLESFFPPESGDVHHCSLAFEVKVPRRFNIRLRSAGGSVTIAGLQGSCDGHTGAVHSSSPGCAAGPGCTPAAARSWCANPISTGS